MEFLDFAKKERKGEREGESERETEREKKKEREREKKRGCAIEAERESFWVDQKNLSLSHFLPILRSTSLSLFHSASIRGGSSKSSRGGGFSLGPQK